MFRNSLDHGIEEVNERIDQGKDEFGRIECIVTLKGQRIFLTIKDDGRGADLDNSCLSLESDEEQSCLP